MNRIPSSGGEESEGPGQNSLIQYRIASGRGLSITRNKIVAGNDSPQFRRPPARSYMYGEKMTAPTVLAPAASEPAPDPKVPVASAMHTLGLLIFLTAWAYLGRLQAIHMRAQAVPNRLQMYLPTLAAEWIFFGYVVYGVRRHGMKLRDLIGAKWKTAGEFGLDVAIAAGFWLTSLVILTIVARLLRAGSAAEDIKFMMPQGAFEIVLWVALSITAGICEETIFRGYLQRQFSAWTRNVWVGVIISAVLFGAGHIYQGAKRAIVIAVFGAMFGILAAMRHSLKPGMMAHGWQDSIAGIGMAIAAKFKSGGF